MKKYFVLTILFVLPIIIYLFFLTGEHNFFKLPVITEDVHDINDFSNFQLKGKITIISFFKVLNHSQSLKTIITPDESFGF